MELDRPLSVANRTSMTFEPCLAEDGSMRRCMLSPELARPPAKHDQ
jgi:hypothetical protein